MVRRISSLLILVIALSVSLSSGVQSAQDDSTGESTELVVAVKSRDESGGSGSGWFARVLRELFDDIDWEAIEKAREQVEKFVKKVDRLIKTFRSETTTTTTPTSQNDGSAAAAAAAGKEGRLNPQGKWWTSGPKLATGIPVASAAIPGALAGELSEASDVKAMLERVACFLGYMRILTDSNQALAELDAAKVVSNLFSATTGASSGGGFFKRLFG